MISVFRLVDFPLHWLTETVTPDHEEKSLRWATSGRGRGSPSYVCITAAPHPTGRQHQQRTEALHGASRCGGLDEICQLPHERAERQGSRIGERGGCVKTVHIQERDQEHGAPESTRGTVPRGRG